MPRLPPYRLRPPRPDVLSVEECRRILGQPTLSDAEVAEIRDTLIAFAQLFIEDYRQRARAADASRSRR